MTVGEEGGTPRDDTEYVQRPLWRLHRVLPVS
jgi:hypothetical protein